MKREVPFLYFEVPGRLVGLNEIIGAARAHYHSSASLKKKQQKLVTEAIKADGVADCHVTGPCRVEITWVEPRRNRDIDNICAGTKFVLDALVQLGVLDDDNQKNVVAISHDVICDPGNPRIRVWVKSVASK